MNDQIVFFSYVVEMGFCSLQYTLQVFVSCIKFSYNVLFLVWMLSL